ncbi:MAG: hypothetical protein HZB40_20245 [Rhodocyclales bacterium]|nr:hypothetical protein [Rhodocyclales bacterium]
MTVTKCLNEPERRMEENGVTSIGDISRRARFPIWPFLLLLAFTSPGMGAGQSAASNKSPTPADVYSDVAPDTSKALVYNHRQLLRIVKSSPRAETWVPDSQRETDGPICREILDSLRSGSSSMPTPVAALDDDTQIDEYYTRISEIAEKYGKYAEPRISAEYAARPKDQEAALKQYKWQFESDFLIRDSYQAYSTFSFLLSRPRPSDDRYGSSPVPNVTRRLYANGVSESGEARYLQIALFGDRRFPDKRFIGIATWGLSPDFTPGFFGTISSFTNSNPYRYFGVYAMRNQTFAWGIQSRPRGVDVPADMTREGWTWMVTLESPLGRNGERDANCIILLK